MVRAEVNLPLSRARFELVGDQASGTMPQVFAAIRDAGYEVPSDALEPNRTVASRVEVDQAVETRALRRAVWLAALCTGPLLVIAMAHVAASPGLVIAQLVLSTVVMAGAGTRYVRSGLAAIAHRSPDMNTLIALGAGAAWLSSTVAALRYLAGTADHHGPDLYFEASAAIITFVTIGKLLEARARARLSDAVRGLIKLRPERAHRVDGSEIAVDDLVVGDEVVVKPGERVPGDGTVTEGRSAVDESLLTGEPLPVDKDSGAPVYAGTLNHHGALRVRLARVGGDTSLARIARAVEEAQSGKPVIARLADRASAVFVPAVLAIAVATAVGWLLAGATTGTAIEHAVAVLVIACPCALGLATPAAIAVGTSRGAELGVLFRNGSALEAASRIDVACFDKTGTLTSGHPSVVGDPDPTLLRTAAAVERASEHPIARAIVAAAEARGLERPLATEVVVDPGAGIAANVEGTRVRVGTLAYLTTASIDVTGAGEPSTASVAHVAIDDRYAGSIAIADSASPVAHEVIAALRLQSITAVLVTGDREAPARAIAAEVGIDSVHAGLKPADKVAVVAGQRTGGRRVAMIGDGLNDAPALAAADVGIALGSGTEIAAASADVTLVRGLGVLPTALALARATLATIRRNLIAASMYNVICIPVAAAGLLSPVLASAAMSLSSVSVLMSSLRLRRFS